MISLLALSGFLGDGFVEDLCPIQHPSLFFLVEVNVNISFNLPRPKILMEDLNGLNEQMMLRGVEHLFAVL